MSRKFCLLPQGFSESCALDCERRHKHLSLREIEKLEGNGEIEFLDVHPLTKKARYVERDFRKSSTSTQIGKKIIMAAAGAYKNHRGEIRSAKKQIEHHGTENRELLRTVSHEFTLSGVKWTDEGILTNFETDGEGSVASFDAEKGYPVTVFLRPRIPGAAMDAAVEYRRFMLRQPNLLREMAKTYFREQKEALRQLNRHWPEICLEICAGPFSQALNASPAAELPSVIFWKILQSYLS